jgi:hypothetical protein
LLHSQQWIVHTHGPTRRTDGLRKRLYRLHQRILVGGHLEAQTVGMRCPGFGPQCESLAFYLIFRESPAPDFAPALPI